jgi:hypothetical protein
MFISFFPRAEAHAVLEAHYESQAQRGEIEAELGSSLFHSGAPSWDAAAWAREEMNLRETEYLATPEGELNAAKVDAALFMLSAIAPDVHITDADDCDGLGLIPWGATLVPEYSPHYSRRDFNAPTSEDIPF